jgi:hypothetical protein
MSTSINLPVLLAQLPHLQELAGHEAGRPEMQAAFNQQMAAEHLKLQNSQVQETDPEQAKLDALSDQKNRERPAHRQARRRPKPHQADEDEDEPQANPPWSGNILNLKI